jgi:hypothetical protein
MELGVRAVADPAQRKQMEARVKAYKEEIQKLTSEMHSAESDYSARERLFSGKNHRRENRWLSSFLDILSRLLFV